MHEFSLTGQILDIVIETAGQHGLKQIKEVRLLVGSASGVNVDAVQFAWAHLRTTHPATGEALLQVELRQARGTCNACGYEGELETWYRLCPSCGEGRLRLDCGDEFMVTDLLGE